MHIGFVGLGVMGSEMIVHLDKAGHSLALFDVDEDRIARCVARCTHARAATSLADAAQGADVVVTMLPNGRIVQACVTGKPGLLEGMAPDCLLIDTSSSEPHLTRETAAALEARGVRMVDAPVSGAVEGAQAAELVFMVGGNDDDVADARDVLKPMGERIFHVGPLGSGHLMKTVNNLATALSFMGTLEAMQIGKANGLDPTAMLEVLNVSTGRSFMTQERIGQFIISGSFADAFKLALMLKDMNIALEEAHRAGLSLPTVEHGVSLWTEAAEALGPDASIVALAKWYEKQTGQSLVG